jgi:hypothetical protein
MNLKDLPLADRRKLTRMSPTLVSSFPNAGKSFCVEGLPEEEKQRTIIIDLESKGTPNDFDDQYRTVVRIKPVGMIPPEKAHLYVDYENVKYKSLPELMVYMRAALAHPDVDRIVIDSFTSLVDQLELYFVTLSNGFTVWLKYSQELTEWFSLLKEEARFNAKYIYVLGHYRPSKPTKDGKIDTEAERFTVVKGTMHHKLVESNFNCVLTIEDHKLVADNSNEYDSTRIHQKLSPYESQLNSFKEFEEDVAKIFQPQE